jgi:hypothetical protein
MDYSKTHLDAETAYGLESGELGADEERRAREHLRGCGLCQAEVQLARSFLEGSAEPVDAEIEGRLRAALPRATAAPKTAPRVSPRPRNRRWPSWFSGGLLAAGLAVIVLGVWQLRPQSADLSGGTLRSGDGGGSWNLEVVSTGSAAWWFRWVDQPQAEIYTLVIQSTSGRTIWEAQSREAAITIERATLIDRLEPGETYFVSVLYAQGGVERRSPLVTLPFMP